MAAIASLVRVTGSIGPGERVFLPGSAGEPTALIDHLLDDPDRTRGLEILTSFVPGINPLGIDRLHESARVTGLFMQPEFRAAQSDGRYRHLPVSFSGFVRHLRERATIDTCVVQVSAPNGEGMCSLGPSVEFTPLAMARSRRTIGLVNARTPAMPGAPSLPLSDFDLAVEVDTPLKGYEVGPPSASARAIAERVAPFVRDGAALQVGLGKVPDALFALLRDRKRLRLSSGMLADGALDLCDAGALDPDFRHRSCVWVGSAALYERLAGRPEFDVLGCEVTHDVGRLAALDGLIAVNSALSVDLFGQANLEHAGGRAVSGVGGAGDFAPAAHRSRGGLSIIAMPASFGRGPISRIVPRLVEGVASLPRTEIDLVVTEHGVADLRGACVHERAEALVAVADPAARSDLTEAWREIRTRL